jgi:transcriptional regulator with GAF, ATPase, and Fis domain
MQPNSPSAYLIIRQGSRWTDVFRLEPGKNLVIGRASSNEIPIPDDRSSRRHAEIYFDGGWRIRDLGSRNGTFVDGERISGPKDLSPGTTVTVASCRMTFSHSLEDIAPPLDSDAPPPDSTQTADNEVATIVHRQSKSAILDPASLGLSALSAAPGGAASVPKTGTPMATASKPVAKESDLARGCELALDRLLAATCCQSAGILRLTPSSKGANSHSSRSVIAAIQKSGRAYHPVSDKLANAVLKEGSAILARNVHLDTDLVVTGSATAASQESQIRSTTSVILAPIRTETEVLGLVHLYSRLNEPDLAAEDLEVTLAVAEVLATFMANLSNRKMLENRLYHSKSRIQELEQQLGHSDQWVSASTGMARVREQVLRVATTNATILLRGESGSGKEVVARAIHDASQRSAGPFVAMNCAALTPTLLESELFGHEKGAFTGATDRKAGKFEQAHGGTIMLDELGEMSMEIQSKFLRILEGKPFERVGGSKPIVVDVRVIAATNKDLEQAVKDGVFRSDLYFRLRVIELRIPPLRERPEDVMLLANHFLQQFQQRSGHGPRGFTSRAIDAMKKYHWPGNVRELRNCVERAHVLSPGELAEPEDLALSHLQVPGMEKLAPLALVNTASPAYRERTIEDVETEHIRATLEYTGGQKNIAAVILGIERSTLDRKLKKMYPNDSDR